MTFWNSKITIRKTDRLFSLYIRKRDGRCVYAVKCSGHPRDIKELDCSHYHGRRKESVRFDPENCDAACKACHLFVHTAEGQKWLDEWKENKLGIQRFNLLNFRANMTRKRDDELDLFYIKSLTQEQERLTLSPEAIYHHL